MKLLPEDTYFLKVKNGNLSEKLIILEENTLEGNPYVMQITRKSFIGRIAKKDFKIISAQLPFGLAVVLKGDVNSDYVKLDLSLHPLLKVFFYFFSTFVALAFVLSIFQGFQPVSILSTLMFLLIIRFGFVGGAYYMGKKLALSKLDLLFEERLEKL